MCIESNYNYFQMYSSKIKDINDKIFETRIKISIHRQ